MDVGADALALGKKTNRKDVPPRRVLLRGSAFLSPQKMLEAAIWPREPRSWLGPHAEGSASGYFRYSKW